MQFLFPSNWSCAFVLQQTCASRFPPFDQNSLVVQASPSASQPKRNMAPARDAREPKKPRVCTEYPLSRTILKISNTENKDGRGRHNTGHAKLDSMLIHQTYVRQLCCDKFNIVKCIVVSVNWHFQPESRDFKLTYLKLGLPPMIWENTQTTNFDRILFEFPLFSWISVIKLDIQTLWCFLKSTDYKITHFGSATCISCKNNEMKPNVPVDQLQWQWLC